MYLVFVPMYQAITVARYLCILVRWIIYHMDTLSFLFWKPLKYLPSLIYQFFRLSLLYLIMFYLVEVLQINNLTMFATSCFCDVLHDHPFVPIFWDIFSMSFWSRIFSMWFSLFLLFIEIWFCLGTSSSFVIRTQIYFQQQFLGFYLLPKFILRGGVRVLDIF